MNVRLALLTGISILILGGLFFFLRPKTAKQPVVKNTESVTVFSSTPSTSDKLISLVVKNNSLASGESIIKLTEGDNLILTVTSDADDELHIHGYDKEIKLQKDAPIQIMLKANITGRFPIELHNTETEIAVLEVQPK